MPQAEKRILFLITGLARGGAETQLTQLAIRLKKRGWEVKVISIMPARFYAYMLQEAGIPVVSLNVQRKTPNLLPFLRLISEIRRWRPQIVHSFMIHANLLARLVRPFVSVPVLLCSIRSVREGGRLRELLYRVSDRLCTLTTHVSKEGLERYVKIKAVPRHKILYIPNGVDTQRFVPDKAFYFHQRALWNLKEDDFLWLAVGRLFPAKDYPNLLRAFSHVVSKQPHALLWVAGDGSLRMELQQLSKALGLHDRVAFLGARTDVPELMRVADAFVLSSAWEGMPNVVLEAAASALPIVATKVSGVPAIVLENQTGYLVPPKNPEALAEAMLRMMHLTPEQRQWMGAQGRQYVREHFDLERIVERWECLYYRLLGQPRHKSNVVIKKQAL